MRALDAVCEVRGPWCRACEESERTVDVEPRVVALGEIGQRVDRIEIASVHLAGVADDDCRGTSQIAERHFHRGEVDAADVVPCESPDRVAPDASIARNRLRDMPSARTRSQISSSVRSSR